MGEITFGLGLAIGSQSTLGTADPTIAALSGALNVDDGIVLGDPDSGIGETGISLSVERRLKERAAVSGSFTRQPSQFLGVDIATLQIAFELKGNGNTQDATLNDSDYVPAIGVHQILQAVGLTSASWTGGNGQIYTPAAAAIKTAKVWTHQGAFVIKDIVGSLEVDFTPGGVAIATATLGGVFDSFDGTASLPTFDYATGTLGDQTISAPVLQNLGHFYGIGSAQRGFTTARLLIDNQIEDVPDSNATGGVRKRQSGRTISLEASIYSDDGDPDFEVQELQRTTTPTDDLQFQAGAAAGNGDVIKGFRVRGPNPEVRSWAPDKGGVSGLATVELALVDTAAGGEFELIFL